MKKPYPQHVVLEKTDTCLTYALKRTGYSSAFPQIKGSEGMLEKFERHIYESTSILEPGTLILWTENERWQTLPCEITTLGLILSHERLIGSHYGVYEGDGLISDCTISSKDFFFSRTIRMRRLEEMPPTHYLTLK